MTSTKLGLGALLVFLGLSQACAAPVAEEAAVSTAEIRALDEREALADLEVVGSSLRLEYGPLEYKKARYGFDLDAELAVAATKIRAAKTEGDRIRPFYELLAKLRDGHVSIGFRVRADESVESSLGFFVTPIQGEYYVAGVGPGGMVNGDRLVSIDGLSTQKLESLLFPISEVGTPANTRHKVGTQMTSRPFYVPAELAPRGEMAHVVFEHADGTQGSADVRWVSRAGISGQIIPAVATPAAGVVADAALSPHLAYVNEVLATAQQRGSSTPFYLTPQVRQALGLVDVKPTAKTLAGFGVFVDDSMPAPTGPLGFGGDRFPMRAYKYEESGKRILLVRIPGFTVPLMNFDENVAWLAAVLSENEGSSDVVVVDVTHNPGGSVPYVAGLASLFTTKPIPNVVQAGRASRAMVNTLIQNASFANAEAQPIWLKRLHDMEDAFDRGDHLAPFAPMSGTNLAPTIPFVGVVQAGTDMLSPHPLFQWKKPVLVLHDELSGSGGDAFPLTLQHGGIKTFGATTAGMGGSVQGMMLPNSAASFSFTRGLFGAYDPDPAKVDLVENEGVTPDYPHAISIADYRAGYVEYARAFSRIAAGLR